MKRKWIFVLVIMSVFWGCQGWGFGEEKTDEASKVVIRTSSAEYDEKTGKIVAEVSTLEWQGIRIVCPFLEVDTKTQEVKSEGEIRITWDDFTAQAKSLWYRRSENILTLSAITGGNTSSRFTSQTMDFDFTSNVIRLHGSPSLQLKDLTLRADEVQYLLAQKLWQAQGVEVTRGEWQGKARQARYSEKDRSVVLEEEARVWKGENVLRGQRILLGVDTGQVKVEGDVEINLIP